VSKDFIKVRIEDLVPSESVASSIESVVEKPVKVLVFSEDCSVCKDLLTKDLLTKLESEGVVLANVEEALMYGADFLDSNLLTRDLVVRTPTVVVVKEGGAIVESAGDRTRIEYLLFGKITPPKARRKEEGGSSTRSRSSSRRSRRKTPKQEEFIENKKTKRLVKEALDRCDKDICVEEV
jgi:thiol-disulfide isomerase/thioredoxin